MRKLQLFNEWKDEYLARTYLRHDSDEQLLQRRADLLDNILMIDAEGGLIIDEGEQFRRLLAHALTAVSSAQSTTPMLDTGIGTVSPLAGSRLR